MAGTITTAAQERLDAVLVVGTDDGGELFQCYVRVTDGWVTSAELPEALGVDRREVFPFGHEPAIPLEVDTMRDDVPRPRRGRLP